MLVFKVVWDTEFNADGSTYLCHIQNIRFSNLILSIYNMQLSKNLSKVKLVKKTKKTKQKPMGFKLVT